METLPALQPEPPDSGANATLLEEATSHRKKTRCPWWLIILAGAVLFAIVVSVFFLTRPASDADAPPSGPPPIPSDDWSNGVETLWSLSLPENYSSFWADGTYLVIVAKKGDNYRMNGYFFVDGIPRELWQQDVPAQKMSSLSFHSLRDTARGRLGHQLHLNDSVRVHLKTGQITDTPRLAKENQFQQGMLSQVASAVYDNRVYVRCAYSPSKHACGAWDTSGRKLWQKKITMVLSRPVHDKGRILIPTTKAQSVVDVAAGKTYPIPLPDAPQRPSMIPLSDGWVSASTDYHEWSPTGDDKGSLESIATRRIPSYQPASDPEFLREYPLLPGKNAPTREHYATFLRGEDPGIPVVRFKRSERSLVVHTKAQTITLPSVANMTEQPIGDRGYLDAWPYLSARGQVLALPHTRFANTTLNSSTTINSSIPISALVDLKNGSLVPLPYEEAWLVKSDLVVVKKNRTLMGVVPRR